MSFYTTIGYKFALPAGVTVDGSVLLCGAMPMHQLQRRQPKPPKRTPKKPKPPKPPKHPHMTRLLFDPQLYFAGLDANQASKLCANLSTYPWFAVPNLPSFDSGEQNQSEWKEEALDLVRANWPRRAPKAIAQIQAGVEECVDLQRLLGCEAIVLPSPLTFDPTTSYDEELQWIDEGLPYAREITDVPVFATVALSDLCLRFLDPESNPLIELIADAVSARQVDGVYLVVEQASEPQDARQCGNSRVLASVLHLTHLFAHECRLDVVTNFLGSFGVACVAAGASRWSCGWYKSLHRLRLADQGAKGRAFPSYWSTPAATDIHLDSDFDELVAARMLNAIADRTPASAGLLTAAASGRQVKTVPAWEHRMSNVTVCTEHFLHSAVALDQQIAGLSAAGQVARVEAWLDAATRTAAQVAATLGSAGSTRTGHVPAWLDAIRDYRRIHSV